jgi:NADPH:quinone reductase-like Zn-dependent oxidoreductase
MDASKEPPMPASTAPANTAAWINAVHAPLEVGPAPYTPPADDQIVVRNHAIAVNPLEWIIQVAGTLTYRWLKYPAVLGSDVAGEVVETGRAVTRFRVGDRVLGHAAGTDKDSNRPAEGGFQQYTVLLERMACPIPDSLAFTDAAVLPLGVSTAACALFQDDQLGLRPPALEVTPADQTVLVWGGSTSVGSNAIQLATAAGYEVITTASPRNFEYVKSLGAVQAFDYNSPEVVADIIAVLRDRTLAGAAAIGPTSAPACVRIAGAASGRRFVSVATPPVTFDSLADSGRSRLELPRLVLRLVGRNVALQASARRRGVGVKYIFGTTLKANQVSGLVYRDFLPGALAAGRYLAAPKPLVTGHGLPAVQRALDIQRAGVSAAKVVVTLP